jgi:hypothetical protein
VAPQALIDTVLPLVQLQARKLGARVQVDVAPDLPAVWCEPTMIEQVLLNLARNGLQAMADQSGERVLSLQAHALAPAAGQAVLEFRVADTGEGIDDAVAEHLFHAVFHHQGRGHGAGPVAVPHGDRAARRRAAACHPGAARHGVFVHSGGGGGLSAKHRIPNAEDAKDSQRTQKSQKSGWSPGASDKTVSLPQKRGSRVNANAAMSVSARAALAKIASGPLHLVL